MQRQRLWDRNKVIIHNLKTTEIKVEQPADVVKKEIPTIQRQEEKKVLNGYIKIFCLPAKNLKDDLYDNTYIKFGDKFIFDGKILSEQDLFIVIASSVELPMNSIIFPRNNDRRWWKIVKMNKQNDLFIYNGIPSEITPDFS